MANQITGRLIEVGSTMSIPSKNGGAPLFKREFLLDATPFDPYTGEISEYKNILQLDMTGDKCAELDKFRTGEVVTVHFVLRGREWINADGITKRMVSVNCFRIEARQKAQQPSAQRPEQSMNPMAQPMSQAASQPVGQPAPAWQPQGTLPLQRSMYGQGSAAQERLQQPQYPAGGTNDGCPF